MNHLSVYVHIVFHHHVKLVSLNDISATTYYLGGALENLNKIQSDREFKRVLMLKGVKRPYSSGSIRGYRQYKAGEFFELTYRRD